LYIKHQSILKIFMIISGNILYKTLPNIVIKIYSTEGVNLLKKKIYRKYTQAEFSRFQDTELCLDLLETVEKENNTDLSRILAQKVYPLGNSALILHGKANPLNVVENILVKKDYTKPAGQMNYECIGKLHKSIWLSDDKSTVNVNYQIESSQPDIYV
jgi:hypothetical protein